MTEATPAMESILAKPLHAVVGINRAGKPAQLTVVWFDWDGEAFRFSTTRNRAKFRNLLRDPALSVLVNDPATASYVVAYGRARVDESGHAELSRRMFARYLPGHDPGCRPEDPDRVVITMTPERMAMGA